MAPARQKTRNLPDAEPSPGSGPDAAAGTKQNRQAPRYQMIADDLISRTAALWRSRAQEAAPDRSMAQPLPSVGLIARHYRIPVPTAQFARRAAVTRLSRLEAARHAHTPDTDHTDADHDVQGGRPAYRSVLEDLRTRILTGDLSGRLPRRIDLANQYGVRADTIGRALRTLTHQGLLLRDGPRGHRTAPDLR